MSKSKEVAKAIVEQIVEAQAWVERYPIDKTVGDIPLQAWKESFELETGTIVRVEVTTDTDKVGRESDGQWVVGLKLDDHWSAGLHEQCHMRWSPFDEVVKAGEEAARLMGQPHIRSIVNVIEDPRIENIGNYWWPAVEIGNNHRAALLREIFKRSEKKGFNAYVIPDDQGSPQSLHNALLYYIYDIPHLCLDQVANDVISRFGKEIRSAVMNPGGFMGIGDKLASVRLAIKISKYLKWKEQQPDEPEGCGNMNPEPGQGQPGDSGNGGAGNGDDSDDASGDDSDASEGDSQPDSGDDSDSIDALIKQIEGAVAKEVKVIQRNDKARQRLHSNVTTGNLSADHPWTIIQIPQYAPPLHDKLRSMLDSYTEPIAMPVVARHGRFDARKTGRLQRGDTRVFHTRPKTKGPVLIMVDCSGSMGCSCALCDSGGRSVADGLGIPATDMLVKEGAAWQLARSIAKAVGDAEVYGFDGIGNARLAPMREGMQPTCNSLHMCGGTPICSVMQWLERRVQGIDNSTILFITDGEGYGCPKNISDHSFQIATRMHATGVDFIAIQLGDHVDTFPSSVLIKIPVYGRHLVNANDLPSVGVAIKHIRENR